MLMQVIEEIQEAGLWLVVFGNICILAK